MILYTHTHTHTHTDNLENKGITLIALVITIIILLILAGITITQITGRGLFGKAEIAKQKTRYVTAKEIINLKLMEIQTDCISKAEEYNIVKIAEEMEKAENIIIEKYYNKDIASIKEDIEKNITNLKGIVVSVEKYSEYKFLIGEECQIKGVLQGEIKETTDISKFKEVEEFEKEISVEGKGKIPGVYYLYHKGNEYKDIGGEWVNNKVVPEYATGKLTKEKEYMIYEAGTANIQNPSCTKKLTMDISSYDIIRAEVELIGENGGTNNRNVLLNILDKNGNLIKNEYKHGQGKNELAVGEIRTVSMNIQDVEQLEDVYFGISIHGYKIKIHSIYLEKLSPFKILVSDNSGNYNIEGKIINR